MVVNANTRKYLAVIAEPQCVDFEHAKVNAALIMTTCQAFPEERFLFVAEHNHLMEVKNIISGCGDLDNLDFLSVKVAPRKLSQPRRLFPDLSVLRNIFSLARESKFRLVMLLSINSSILLGVKLLQLLFRRVAVLGIPHSVLASIMDSAPPRLIDKLFQFRTIIQNMSDHRVNYLILGQSIYSELERELPSLRPKCHVLNHPYPFPENNSIQPAGKLVFAFLGVAQATKGFDKFAQLARGIRGLMPGNSNIHFLCAGGNPFYEFKMSDLEGIDVPFAGEYVPEGEYQKLCKSITYAVLPYERDSYRLYPSGAVFDAFTHLKPIICLRNAYFEYLFGLMGDIGYICNDYSELLLTVQGIADKFPAERYQVQQRNLESGRKHFSPEQLKNQMHGIIERIINKTC